MGAATAIVRWLFGGFYTFIGASWLFHQITGRPWATPPEPPQAEALTDALTASGLVDPLIASVCLLGGLLLLRRRTAPLGVVVLAPLVISIFLFHRVLTGSVLWGSLHLAVWLLLVWLHRAAFRPLYTHPFHSG